MKELIVFNSNNKKVIALLENEELVEKYEEDEKNKSIEGNIYVGKVQNVLTGLQSAFVNIGEKKAAFIHVEVKREAIDKKGPRLSTHISLSSRFIVFMPNANFITVSQKIEDEGEKERLKNIAKKYLPEGTGAIIRTVAEKHSEKELKEDILKSIENWKRIKEKNITQIPQKIYDKGGIIKKTIIDLVDSNLDKIILQSEEDVKLVKDILSEIGTDIKVEIDSEILEKYSLEKQLKALKTNKIWLKSGAFITIDKTEALVAIDVNSGKFIGKKNVEETVTAVNLEAAKEISKQIRLRDISGIIIIDFIDMYEDKNKEAVINEVIKNSKKDRSKVQVEEFTKLNLMELTRKHINSKKEE